MADSEFSDSDYRAFNSEADKPGSTEENELPSRYQTKTTNPERLARAQARVEARRTRRTMRMQQQQQQQQQQKQQLHQVEQLEEETHYKINVEGDSSDESSVDENYDVASIDESIPENLT